MIPHTYSQLLISMHFRGGLWLVRKQQSRCGVAEKRHQITVLLDEEEYSRFNAYCNERGFKKSTLVARLIRDHLDNEGYRLQRSLPLSNRKLERK